jgi:hypothetical protein
MSRSTDQWINGSTVNQSTGQPLVNGFIAIQPCHSRLFCNAMQGKVKHRKLWIWLGLLEQKAPSFAPQSV